MQAAVCRDDVAANITLPAPKHAARPPVIGLRLHLRCSTAQPQHSEGLWLSQGAPVAHVGRADR